MCRCLADAGTVPAERKDLDILPRLTGSFALTRERPPSRCPVPLGGKPGGKIVKRRARRAVAGSAALPCGHISRGRLPLPAVGGTARHCTALATAMAPHQQSVRRVPAMSSGCLRRRRCDGPTRETGTMADSGTTPLTASPAVGKVNQDDESRMRLGFLQYQRESVLKIVRGCPRRPARRRSWPQGGQWPGVGTSAASSTTGSSM